jgi:cellulose synthase (UDP-forming)
MVQHLVTAAPSAFALAFFLVFALNWPRERTWSRSVAGLFILALTARYLAWRLEATVLPHPADGSFGFLWVWFVFAIELLALADLFLLLLTMSRYKDRVGEAGRLERNLFSRPASELPTVDVFIPTYNEPIDVLERTIVGALALDYPREKMKVYVLDDTQRDWLKQFCEEKGALYVTRPGNVHAKAGNMNNGLAVSQGEFIAIFDADFVPYRNFLRRTVGFFADSAIGIVQTPQHFFNKDPVQSNLWLERDLPDEQRLFFDVIAASRDAWDVSFCCGSCSVIRREALEAIGGFPTESVTEDLLTTLACLNKGYKTRYLNERLSMGLAAENLQGYFIQRGRWCRGGIQTLFLKNGPIRGPGLTLFQRVMFLPLSWLVQYLVRFVVLLIPAVYLWTGAAPLYFTSTSDIIYYQGPVLVANFLFMAWLLGSHYIPLLTTAVGAFGTFRLLPVVIASLIRPFGVEFKVTPKGSANDKNYFDSYTFTAIAILIAVTTGGLIINLIPEWAVVAPGEFGVLADYWAVVNIVVLALAAMICFEVPRRAREDFIADERVAVHAAGKSVTARVTRLSLGYVTIELQSGQPLPPVLHTIELDGVQPLPARIVRHSRLPDGGIRYTVVLNRLTGRSRDDMIVKLYTGKYSRNIRRISALRIVAGLWNRAFGDLRPPARVPDRRASTRGLASRP